MASIGVEPIRPFGHRILSPARLPIPPRGLRVLAMPAARHYRDAAMMRKQLLLLGILAGFLLPNAGCTSGGRHAVPGVQNFGQVTPEVWRGGKPSREGMQSLA